MQMQMRIVKARYKLLYLVVAYAILLGVEHLLRAADPSGIAALAFAIVFGNGLLVVAVRLFRVTEEDVPAPRPLWRLTGRPTAGYWLFAFHLLGILSVVGNVFTAPRTESRSEALQNTPAVVVLQALISLAWAVLYFRSSRRLARARRLPSAIEPGASVREA